MEKRNRGSLNRKVTFFFEKDEFNRNDVNWYDLYDPRWLVLIDTFRLYTGVCQLSPHSRALGRNDGRYSRSGYDGHNIDKHGLVMAGDCFPNINSFQNEFLSAKYSFDVAKDIGFTGIGFYPQWTLNGKRRFGFHFDTRRSAEPKSPAAWGYVNGKMVEIEKAFNFLMEQVKNENI